MLPLPSTSVGPVGVTVDGVRLDTLAWNISTRSGWDTLPEAVGSNVRVPARHGAVWRRKDFGEGRMVLDLFVLGCAPDGRIPLGSNDEEEYRRNLDLLLALFGRRDGLLEVVKDQADGSSRVNFGEVTAALSPDVFGGTSAQMRVEITFPDPFWRDASGAVAVEPAASATSPRTHRLDALAGSTAPILDATVLVEGPAATGVRVADAKSGAYLELGVALAAGQTWRIRAGDFVSETGTGLGFTGGTATNRLTQTVVSASPRYLPLTPDPADGFAPSLTLSGSGFGSTTRLRVQATRRFLA